MRARVFGGQRVTAGVEFVAELLFRSETCQARGSEKSSQVCGSNGRRITCGFWLSSPFCSLGVGVTPMN